MNLRAAPEPSSFRTRARIAEPAPPRRERLPSRHAAPLIPCPEDLPRCWCPRDGLGRGKRCHPLKGWAAKAPERCGLGLIGSGPRGTGKAQECEGLRPCGELEIPSGRYDQRIARPYLHGRRVVRVAAWRASPDAPGTLQHVPELLDPAMPDRSGALPGIQGHLTERSALGRLGGAEQHAYFRPVRGQGVRTPASSTNRRTQAFSAHTPTSEQDSPGESQAGDAPDTVAAAAVQGIGSPPRGLRAGPAASDRWDGRPCSFYPATAPVTLGTGRPRS